MTLEVRKSLAPETFWVKLVFGPFQTVAACRGIDIKKPMSEKVRAMFWDK
jgi:hypothetical protein